MANHQRPYRRASVGTYEAVIDGVRVVFQRDGRRGFLLRMGRGSLSMRFKRLCDAYDVAAGAVAPKIFDRMESDTDQRGGGSALRVLNFLLPPTRETELPACIGWGCA